LEINEIERYYITHAIRASPTNEGLREVIPGVARVPSIAKKMVPSNERIYKRGICQGLPLVGGKMRMCSQEADNAPSYRPVGRKRRSLPAVSLLGSSKVCEATSPTALLCQDWMSPSPAGGD